MDARISPAFARKGFRQVTNYLCPFCVGRGFIATGEYPSETRRRCDGCQGSGADKTGKSKFQMRSAPPPVLARIGRRGYATKAHGVTIFRSVGY